MISTNNLMYNEMMWVTLPNVKGQTIIIENGLIPDGYTYPKE